MTTTNKVLTLAVLSIFAILTFFSTPVESCMCYPAHPQTQYCNSDFVIIARILRKSTRRTRENKDIYKIEIKKAYKLSEKAEAELKHGRLLTPHFDSLCGVDLNVGKLYVIAGRNLEINLCNYVKEYSSMTLVERRGFAGAYKKGCSCRVDACFRGNCPLSIGACNWVPFAKCETNYSACVPARGYTSVGKVSKCHWRRTPPYKDCLLS